MPGAAQRAALTRDLRRSTMGRDARKQDLAGRRRRPVTRSRRPAAMIGIGLVSIAAAGAAIGGAASAAVPEFPNNLVVFPNRDFVTVEGYQDHIGETALLEVTRGRTGHRLRRGGRRGGRRRVRGQPPRRRLLGRRHDLQVTPDIQPGDKVPHLVRRPAGRRHDRPGRLASDVDSDAQRRPRSPSSATSGRRQPRADGAARSSTRTSRTRTSQRRDVRARARRRSRRRARGGYSSNMSSPATTSPPRTSSTPRDRAASRPTAAASA